MAEQSLYRRHRPQSFDQVVGQEHVVRTLRNAIERDRVHHAYLFVGSRGTGKTSMAKILARSLNCEQGPTVTPCGVCEPCRAIAAGTSFDVIEMDAASNRSVDDIRELRERVGYAPAEGSWKVYILDEAHMLTREAWNAFLKTLEEPPPNTVFVLATTEPHKVMPTIVDRCQRFDFGRPTPEHIAEVLRRAATAENITIEDAGIGAIARAANGSFRDGLGTLDQMLAYSGNQIATEDVLTVLGLADGDLLFDAADAIAGGDGRAVLALAAEIAGSGRDPSRFAADLVGHLRQLLVVATVGEVPEHFFVSAEHGARLSAQAAKLGEAAMFRSIDELSAAIAAVREGDDARMTIELAMLRAARPQIDPSRQAIAQRLERLERAVEAAGPPAPALAASPAAATPAAVAPAAPSEPDSPPAAPPGTADAAGSQGADSPAPASPVAEPPDRSEDQPPSAASAGSSPENGSANGVEGTPAASRSAPAAQANPVEAIAKSAVATAEEVRTRVEEVRSEVEARADEVRNEVGRSVEATAQAASEVLDLERLSGMWPAIVDQVKQSGSEFLSAAFQAARPVAVDAERSTVEIGFPPSAAFNKRKAEAKENRERFVDAVRTIVGERLSPSYVMLDEEPSATAPTATAEPAIGDSELVERFKAEFDAEELIEDPPEAEPVQDNGEPEEGES